MDQIQTATQTTVLAPRAGSPLSKASSKSAAKSAASPDPSPRSGGTILTTVTSTNDDEAPRSVRAGYTLGDDRPFAKKPVWARVTARKVLRRLFDAVLDLRASGSVELAAELFTANWHSGHDVLRDLFSRVPVRPDDVIVDVGCGKGRVIGFLSGEFPENRIIGVEVDETALFARRIFAKNPRIEIRHAMLDQDYPREGTVFFLFPPTDGELPDQLKALIDLHATRDTYVVAKGAMGDLAAFRADPTWSVEMVAPPEGFFARLFSTHFIYKHDQRGPGYLYGAILKKTVTRDPAGKKPDGRAA